MRDILNDISSGEPPSHKSNNPTVEIPDNWEELIYRVAIPSFIYRILENDPNVSSGKTFSDTKVFQDLFFNRGYFKK